MAQNWLTEGRLIELVPSVCFRHFSGQYEPVSFCQIINIMLNYSELSLVSCGSLERLGGDSFMYV